MKIKSLFLLLIPGAELTGYATPPPKQQCNLCNIFREKPSWYDDAKDMEDEWGTPIHIAMVVHAPISMIPLCS
jgi:hypothetical protein